jgi:hypothetical protein
MDQAQKSPIVHANNYRRHMVKLTHDFSDANTLIRASHPPFLYQKVIAVKWI